MIAINTSGLSDIDVPSLNDEGGLESFGNVCGYVRLAAWDTELPMYSLVAALTLETGDPC